MTTTERNESAMSPAPQSNFADPDIFVRLREQSLAWRRVVDDVVVLDTDASEYYAVNSAGGALWERLADGATVAALADALVSAYPSASDRAAEDVRKFLAELDASGLLEIVRADAAAPPSKPPDTPSGTPD